eukprot:scaffold39105_cov76-Phaeocystis_antarctica.AAC.10
MGVVIAAPRPRAAAAAVARGDACEEADAAAGEPCWWQSNASSVLRTSASRRWLIMPGSARSSWARYRWRVGEAAKVHRQGMHVGLRVRVSSVPHARLPDIGEVEEHGVPQLL